jgi:hypothetical protein
MALWRKLFGSRQGVATTPSSGESGPNLKEKMDAAATVIRYRHEGWLDLVRDGSGEAVGFWLERHPGETLLPSFLKMAAASEKLAQGTYISIALGDYRVVPNSFDDRGGHYVMIGPARAPGEQVASLQSVRWIKGESNPKSPHVERFTRGVQGVRFACPTCKLPNYCYDSALADDAGAMVECGHCGNVAHVPAAYKSQTTSEELEIRGCAYIPIADYRDWFFAHPCYSSGNAEDFGSYGLWGYCAACKHEFAGTVLASFPVASMARGLVFNANSPASAMDMRGLLDGQCPDCGTPDLLALMIEIPFSVRDKIARARAGARFGA